MNSTSDSNNLPALPALWAKMRKGAHIHSGDGALFFDVAARVDEYRAAFAQFGYRLIESPARFFYLEGDDADQIRPIRVSEMMALAFVLIDMASTAGFGFDEWFFPQSGESRKVSDLDVFRTQQHRDLLATAQVTGPQDVDRVLKYMSRLGFVRYELGTVSFMPPFTRFQSLCLDLAGRGQEGLDQLAAETAGASPTNSADEGGDE